MFIHLFILKAKKKNWLRLLVYIFKPLHQVSVVKLLWE